MPNYKKIFFILVPCALLFVFLLNSCHVYRFNDASIPSDLKTIKINLIENRAQYVNPQLSPRLSDRLRQKIVSQTRLTQTNGDNPDWEINAVITNYLVSTSGISNQQQTTNQLSVTVHVAVTKRKDQKTDEYDVTHNFQFAASKSLQQAETELNDEMVRTLTDEIFNRLFSNW